MLSMYSRRVAACLPQADIKTLRRFYEYIIPHKTEQNEQICGCIKFLFSRASKHPTNIQFIL